MVPVQFIIQAATAEACIKQAEAVLTAEGKWIELCVASLSSKEAMEVSAHLLKRCHACEATFCVVDDVDLCREVGADGVCLTREDCRVDEVREALGHEFIIGAMTSLRQIELHDGLNKYTHGAVCEAVKDIVGVQFRNLATIGGSIWGRFGFSDILTVFLAMDAFVELYHGGMIPLREFVNMKQDRDVIVHLIIRKTPGVFAYASVRNQRTDFPVIACSASCVDGEYRLAVGARPGRAMLVLDEEGLLTEGLSDDTEKAFAIWVSDKVPVGSNHRAGAEYRSRLIRVLGQRLLKKIEEEQQWK